MSNEAERIDRLEQRVDYLIRYLGISPADIMDDVLRGGAGPLDFGAPRQDGPSRSPGSDWIPEALYGALRQGKTIEAIKIYRSVTGAGLKEAKAAVERIAREM
jgi:ribosomal protein L7/L12